MSNVVSITDAPKSKQEKLELYAEALCNGLTREAAYIEAGYSGISARANANKYHRANSEFIQAYISEHIGSHAPTALKIIKKIMLDENEKGGIRLKAAQDLLDRGGFSAKTKIELTTKDVKDLSTEELEYEIRRLISENPEFAAVIHPS